MLRASTLLAMWAMAAVSGCAIVHEQRLSVAALPSEQHAQVEIDIAVNGRRESYYSIPPQRPAASGDPGTITVRSDDVRREYAVLSVQTIEVQYTDSALAFEERSFERCQTEFVDGHAELPIRNAFTCNGDATVIVRGTLHAANGEARPFECRREVVVVVESDWQFSTWLDWIASC